MKIGRALRLLCVTAPVALGACSGVMTDIGLAPAYPDSVAESPYQAGKRQFALRQYGLAVKSFQEAVNRDPSSVEALNGLAATYDQLGRFDLSARYYGRALALAPDSSQTLNNIGYSYLMQDRNDLAVAYLRDAYGQDRDDAVVVANRDIAEVALEKDDLKAAKTQGPLADLPASKVAETRQEAAKPWIERTTAEVQTLVLQPQYAMVETADAAGVPPELASYRPTEVEGAQILPEPMASPLEERSVMEAASADMPVSVEAIQMPPAAVTPVQVAELVVHPVSQPTRVSETVVGPVSQATQVSAVMVHPVPQETQVAAIPVDAVEEEELGVAALTAPIQVPKQPVPGALDLPFIEVSNGTGRLHMAARLRDYLDAAGISVRRLTNASRYSHMESVVYYRSGWQAFAQQLAAQLPAAVDLVQNDTQRSDIRVLLGGDLLEFDAGLYYAALRGTNDRSS